MSLWQLLQVSLLLGNSLAILNEDRVLKRYGLSWKAQREVSSSSFMDSPPSGGLKGQIAEALHAASYLRFPLIFINILVVFVKVLFG